MGFSKLNEFAKKMLFNAKESICILNKFLAILLRLDQLTLQSMSEAFKKRVLFQVQPFVLT